MESLVVTGRTGTLTGWLADPSAAGNGHLMRVTVNGVTHDVLVSGPRPDLPSPGPDLTPFGFVDLVTLRPGPNEVCLYEIDTAGAISTAPVTCRTAVVN